MFAGIYRAAAAMNVAEQRQEVIANNLAHMNVPGYRKNVVAVQTFEHAMEDTESSDEMLAEVTADFTPGPIAQSGRNLDVAIDGDGFFVLEGPDGPLYTRNGVFQVSAEGDLVSSGGLKVQGSGGSINLPANASPSQVVVANDGSVTIAGTPAGKLQVVQFDDNAKLIPAGTTVYESPPDMAANDADISVRQGAREMSNVSAVTELIQMITNMRQHEASERVLKALDESLQQTTSPGG